MEFFLLCLIVKNFLLCDLFGVAFILSQPHFIDGDAGLGFWAIVDSALLFLLYAETHYHFRFAPSLIYRRQPEIIADAPHRLEPGNDLPILLIIKDAHRFPITLEEIAVRARPSHGPLVVQCVLCNTPECLAQRYWWRLFPLALPDDWTGWIEINVEITYKVGGRRRRCRNDNYVGTSHRPLVVYKAETPLPNLPAHYHGDLHCHTDGTDDQVEYGAPVEAMVPLARAQGVHFFAATDHSYDLDDVPGDYLHNDPLLRKWHGLQERIQRLNATQREVVIIPGEEVSCGNARGENVHSLVLNHDCFIPGRGDGGEKWLHTSPDLTIAAVLAQLDGEALAYAAHPAVRLPRLEALLLNRGQWHRADLQHARLHGLQFWNGATLGEAEGFEQWRQLLLAGRRVFAIAGNDAHGNFNRSRQIVFPCVNLAESDQHVFGRARTVVKLAGEFNLRNLIAALRQGRNCLTTGPLLDFSIVVPDGTIHQPGDTVRLKDASLCLTAICSPEFGRIEQVIVWRGDLRRGEEEQLFKLRAFADAYRFVDKLPLRDLPAPGYLRVEAVCTPAVHTPTRAARCLTNPIWITGEAR